MSGSHREDVQLRCDPFAADVYSFGFLLYSWYGKCFGVVPEACASVTFEREPRCRAEALDCDYNELLLVAPTLESHEMDGPWGSPPVELQELVAGCMSQEPKLRPKAGEIVSALERIFNLLVEGHVFGV